MPRRVAATLLAIKSECNASGRGAGCTNDADGFADGGTRGDDVVDDQHASFELAADDGAAFAVVLRFLAIERERQVASVQRVQRRGGGGSERNALVGRSEQHVEGQARTHDGFGIAAAEHCKRSAVIEGTGVEEIRTHTSGFQREFAEPQNVAGEGEADEFVLVVVHRVPLCKAAMMSAVRIITFNAAGIRIAGTLRNMQLESWIPGRG